MSDTFEDTFLFVFDLGGGMSGTQVTASRHHQPQKPTVRESDAGPLRQQRDTL